jgi:mannose-1-phosphate guanylyltransferase
VAAAAGALSVAILAGGRGERFWPLSTPEAPKQFLALGGGEGRTLLQQAAARAEGLAPWDRRLLLAGRVHAALVRAQLPELPPHNLLLEPVGRDTAGAIALACAWASLRERDPRLLVMPADHVVPDPTGFRHAVAVGLRILDAHPSALVTFGVAPTRPETGYGYIEMGSPVPGVSGASWARRFTEKPDRATAERFLREGTYRWNSGIFLWRLGGILQALRRHLPAHAALVDRLAPVDAAAWPALLAAEFPRLPKISIDYGVLEKASDVAVVLATFAWDDLGAWSALPRVHPPDGHGNVVRGPARLVDVEDCIVVSAGRPIGALGVRGLVLVEGPGGVLVCPRERAQEVRRLAEGAEGP